MHPVRYHIIKASYINSISTIGKQCDCLVQGSDAASYAPVHQPLDATSADVAVIWTMDTLQRYIAWIKVRPTRIWESTWVDHYMHEFFTRSKSIGDYESISSKSDCGPNQTHVHAT